MKFISIDAAMLIIAIVSLLLSITCYRSKRRNCVHHKRFIGILGSLCVAGGACFASLEHVTLAVVLLIIGMVQTLKFALWFIDYETCEDGFVVYIFPFRRIIPYTDVKGITPHVYGGIIRTESNGSIYSDFTTNWEQLEDAIDWNYCYVLKQGASIPDIPGRFFLGNVKKTGEVLNTFALLLLLITIEALVIVPPKIKIWFPSVDDYYWMKIEVENIEIRDDTLYIRPQQIDTIFYTEISYIVPENRREQLINNLKKEWVVLLLTPKEYLVNGSSECLIRAIKTDARDYISFTASKQQYIRSDMLGICILIVAEYLVVAGMIIIFFAAVSHPGKHPVLMDALLKKDAW